MAHRREAEAAADQVAVWGPASLSNLGPGFDTLGLCIDGYGDRVEAWRSEVPGVQLVAGTGTPVPQEASRNTAAVAAAAVLAQVAPGAGVALRLHKGIPLGSGIGGSAASAVAGAWAVNALFGHALGKGDLVEAVLAGEAVASGSRHGDNVLPALFGGLVLTSATDPAHYRRIPLPGALHLAVVVPEVRILTREARAILPPAVPLRDAVHNASALAFLIEAFRAGDWEAVGRQIMTDRLVEPVRARLVPCYEAVRHAALSAGSLGCALTGSGPALFALAASAEAASHIAEAMMEAGREAGVPTTGRAVQVLPEGVATLDDHA